MQGRRGCLGVFTGCLTKLVVWAVVAAALFWGLIVALNPWALRIGGRSTPLLYWHGMGTLKAKDGREYPLYVTFYPGRPAGFHGGGRREGKAVSAQVDGAGWLCLEPGSIEKLDLSGTIYGGYLSADNSLFDFRFLEWRKAFAVNPQSRGFFDVAGTWHGKNLVLDRSGEQGIRLTTGPFIDNATVTLQWADYGAFKRACRDSRTEDR